MITFGGRPLNTYTTYKGGSQFESSSEPDPVLVEVQPESVRIYPPESNVINPLLGEIETSTSKSPSFHIGGTVLNQKELVKLDKELNRARFKNGFFAKIFGVEIVSFFMFLSSLSKYIFFIFILFIIGSICYFLHTITQGILDVSHKVLEGVTMVIKEVNDVSIKFTVPGIGDSPPLLKVDFKLFGGIFDGPLRDMYNANNFVRDATELIIKVLTQMIKSIADNLPSMIEGLFNVLSKITM
jgi:hypothetical protein